MSRPAIYPRPAFGAPPARESGEAGHPLLQLSGVTIQYKTEDHLVTAAQNINFDVYKADRFVLLGPSGCGKSTLLKSIGGYIKPVSGDIRLNGANIREPGPDRMMVFQDFDQLMPWKTVLQNVMLPLVVKGDLSTAECRERALDFINKVNLMKFAELYPHMLSGGMKQRVAIARAMAMQPEVLLMDEPFAALDALTRRKMQDELLQLWDDLRFTVLFVTHSIEEAIIVGSRILVLSAHPGRVRAELDACGKAEGEEMTAQFRTLERRINAMLFETEVEPGSMPDELH